MMSGAINFAHNFEDEVFAHLPHAKKPEHPNDVATRKAKFNEDVNMRFRGVSRRRKIHLILPPLVRKAESATRNRW